MAFARYGTENAEKMVGVVVGEENVLEGKADPVAHHLALGAFAAIEQQHLSLAVHCEGGDVAVYGGTSCARAEECQGEHGA